MRGSSDQIKISEVPTSTDKVKSELGKNLLQESQRNILDNEQEGELALKKEFYKMYKFLVKEGKVEFFYKKLGFYPCDSSSVKTVGKSTDFFDSFEGGPIINGKARSIEINKPVFLVIDQMVQKEKIASIRESIELLGLDNVNKKIKELCITNNGLKIEGVELNANGDIQFTASEVLHNKLRNVKINDFTLESFDKLDSQLKSIKAGVLSLRSSVSEVPFTSMVGKGDAARGNESLGRSYSNNVRG